MLLYKKAWPCPRVLRDSLRVTHADHVEAVRRARNGSFGEAFALDGCLGALLLGFSRS